MKVAQIIMIALLVGSLIIFVGPENSKAELPSWSGTLTVTGDDTAYIEFSTPGTNDDTYYINYEWTISNFVSNDNVQVWFENVYDGGTFGNSYEEGSDSGSPAWSGGTTFRLYFANYMTGSDPSNVRYMDYEINIEEWSSESAVDEETSDNCCCFSTIAFWVAPTMIIGSMLIFKHRNLNK